MRTSKIVRRLSFIVMVGAIVIGAQAGILADISEFCSAWSSYGCQCQEEFAFPPSVKWSGSCNFEGQSEDPLALGAAYCQDEWMGCTDMCEGGYRHYLADYYWWNYDPNDPCADAKTRASCWITWAQGGCDAGTNSNWTCTCGRFFFCECD